MLLSARCDGQPRRQPWRLASTVLIVSLFSVMCSEQVPDGATVGGPGAPEPTPAAGGDMGGRGAVTGDGDGGSIAGADAQPSVEGPLGDAPFGGAPLGGAPLDGAPFGGAPLGGGGGFAEGGASLGGAPAEVEASGLPCDVEKVLRARCQSCHGSVPVEGAAVSLMTHADLIAPSRVLPSTTVAARSLKRMLDSLTPMPPAPLPAPTAAEVTALRSWLQVGMPPARCEEEANPSEDPYDALATCTSGNFWPADFDGGFWGMMPGRKCLECHKHYPQYAPIFSVAGTVYPTAHEPDRCYGVPVATGAKIVITDANGVEHAPVPVVSGGNFGAIMSGLALPYRAKIVVGDRERVMLTPQTNGDCNVCHSQSGAQGARGRIILP